jgi:hypothetical protein
MDTSATKRTRKKDRDGLYQRRGYWHYELRVDGRRRSYTTGTKDYNQAKKIRADAVRDLQDGKLPNDSGSNRLQVVADAYIQHRQATVSAGTVRLEKERLKPLMRLIGNVKLKDITASVIRKYQATRASGLSEPKVEVGFEQVPISKLSEQHRIELASD